MTVFKLEDLNQKCRDKPWSYRRAVLKVAQKVGEDTYVLSTEEFQRLRERYGNRTGILFKVKSFVKHVVTNALFLVQHHKLLTKKEKATWRYDICAQCPELLPSGFCRVCGCNMKLKTKLAMAECPLGKWN